MRENITNINKTSRMMKCKDKWKQTLIKQWIN